MKTVYLLGRDKPSVLVCLYIMNYKEESIVSSNIVYANENKIMRRNTKKMSRFIAYIIVNTFAAVTLKFLPISVYLSLRERLKNTPEKQPHHNLKRIPIESFI